MSAPFAAAALALLQPLYLPTTVVDADFDRATGFVPPAAVSHAPDLVPYGSHVHVVVVRAAGRTTVALKVSGVAADHEFPAHVHTGHCGADPLASGPHYLNAGNAGRAGNAGDAGDDVRMTVTTDGEGRGSASSTVPWTFRPDEAHSIVLHAGTPAGTHAATDRVACVNVDF